MKPGVVALLLAVGAVAAVPAHGATAYVTDELVLGVYAEQSTQGTRLATLHSGAMVETLAVSGESTQVRLPDGKIGWVKTSYLTTHEPATVRLKQLQDELDRSRATTPALAEAAERSEVERLTRELAERPMAARPPAAPGAAAPDSGAAGAATAAGGSGTVPARGVIDAALHEPAARMWLWVGAVCAALGCGFWLGYASLARRMREKFGGIKVY